MQLENNLAAMKKSKAEAEDSIKDFERRLNQSEAVVNQLKVEKSDLENQIIQKNESIAELSKQHALVSKQIIILLIYSLKSLNDI